MKIINIKTVAFIATVIILIGTFVVVGCKKEDLVNQNTNNIEKKVEKGRKCNAYVVEDVIDDINIIGANNLFFSYTGDVFVFDENYQNPFFEYGMKHNMLVQEIFAEWNNFSGQNFFEEMFAFSMQRSGEMFDVDLTQEKKNLLTDELIESFAPYANYSYINMLESHFEDNYPNAYLPEFIEDINSTTYNNTALTMNNIHDIKIIEQKILHSQIEEEAKNDYLLFCAVYQASLSNLFEMGDNPNFPMCYAKEVTGDRVLADAVGAVKGGLAGAKAGVAGGPVGITIMAGVGAVCGGALATAVEAGIKENAAALIDKGIDKLKEWFK